ncbi:response regulator [Actinoplanes sp. NPDC023714]|uniref:response regulator n=1 Tax=Actinoplanes sp. NPDC023714 TaxID=3154322 RepID=UPI0033C804E9
MNENLILIAEDDADVRELLSFTLQAAGFPTIAVADGRNAADILIYAAPVGLIADVQMPGMNGLDLCRLARRTPAVHNTAVLLFSAKIQRLDADAGMAAGADRYLRKPTRPRHLIAELRQVIADRSAALPATPHGAGGRPDGDPFALVGTFR